MRKLVGWIAGQARPTSLVIFLSSELIFSAFRVIKFLKGSLSTSSFSFKFKNKFWDIIIRFWGIRIRFWGGLWRFQTSFEVEHGKTYNWGGRRATPNSVGVADEPPYGLVWLVVVQISVRKIIKCFAHIYFSYNFILMIMCQTQSRAGCWFC